MYPRGSCSGRRASGGGRGVVLNRYMPANWSITWQSLLLLLLIGAAKPADASLAGTPKTVHRLRIRAPTLNSAPSRPAPAGGKSTPGLVHPAPLLFYNRVSKSGSTTVLRLLAALQTRNGFKHFHGEKPMQYDRLRPGWNEEKAADFFLTSRGSPAVYDCHTYFVDFFGSSAVRARLNGDVSDVHYINVLRNPIQRYRSLFYYRIDPVTRRREWALAELQRRREDPCGCADISFNDCVSRAAAPRSNCSAFLNLSQDKPSNVKYFLTQKDYEMYKRVSCNPAAAAPLVRKALAHMEEYTVIGLTDRMHETVALLEERLPAVFAGAAERYASDQHTKRSHVTHISDHVVAQGPLVSAATDAILRASPCNAGEFALWEHAKQLFHSATGVDVGDL